MKNTILSWIMMLTIAMVVLSCNDNDENMNNSSEPSDNIVELAEANGFTSLALALEKTGLDAALAGDGNFTVFAPTNEAFAALLATIGQSSIDDVPTSVLEKILLYHVLNTSVESSEVTAGSLATLNGASIDLATQSGIAVNGASVISPFDVEASNGIIHTIDAVLVPGDIGQFVNTVLEPAYFNVNYSTLIEAAVKADLVSTLLTTDNLTIFAPNNQAFIDAGVDVSSLSADVLGDVLSYHVIGSKVLAADIPNMATTLNGDIYFSVTGDGVFINGSTKVIATDVESGSGVVHVLDNVLMPPSGNIVDIAVALSEDGEFNSLVAALQRTADEGTAEQNLLTVLSGETEYTVFAPTNAAFQALLDSEASWNTLADIPLETLIAVLTYHVVPGRVFDVDLAGALDASNMLGTANSSASLTFDLNTLTIDGSASITGTNTLATNGVIHVIDAVLVP
ncbi:fasciclin domain-containing protein [Marinoscillum sp. MHG1-6]|uniref:fasciclin domain-containing protein n=1 Tax=Marinoscillum sp. MHG1-6 TaxID=2959627 RepID=UPI0021587A7D|nr:fasciclin domain-containing protein [Marinoscillum sp. MHG1-6]